MSYETGAAKYLLKTVLYPVNYWIFGGALLWVLDVLDLIGADNFNDLLLRYILIHYGIPSSIEDFFVQFVVGAVCATTLWYVAVKRR